jgi:hypothetical protein
MIAWAHRTLSRIGRAAMDKDQHSEVLQEYYHLAGYVQATTRTSC